jgi:hypothetical protein
VRYLTKSRFKLALECVTKLYYTKKQKEYADESLDDSFLEALAEGGFQVGELAKFLFCDDPIGEKITIGSLEYDEALRATDERLSRPGKIVIAEAAFRYESLFIRADLVVKEGNDLNLYEVKSTSAEEEDVDFITKKGTPRISSKWVPYLYDVAFQKYVISKTFQKQKINVRAHLIVVDKSKLATIDGLNQKFKILKQPGQRTRVEVESGLRRQNLGAPILRVQNVDEEIRRIWEEFPVPTDYQDSVGFEAFIDLCAKLYTGDSRVFTPLGKKCKDCQFTVTNPLSNKLKSGLRECWKAKTKLSDDLLNKDLVLTLWGGGVGSRSIVNELITSGKYLIESIAESDIAPTGQSKKYDGLSPHERRMEQVNRIRTGTKQCYFDKQGLSEEMEGWAYPLHMIDFETTMTALPFHKGKHPYEGIAFQFSHHLIEKNGNIRHAGQFLSFDRGVFPNYMFVRELKAQLEKDNGSVFRYHNHENTYLNMIYGQLETDPRPEPDKRELQAFIRSITNWKSEGGGKEAKEEGPRSMIDLYKVVMSYYYSPRAKGSNSLKSMLPAIIADSEYLRSRYSRPIYGKRKEVESLNFGEHIWIDPKFNNDPYRTLEPLFKEYDNEKLDRLLLGFDEIAEGGAAMTAYNYLQFSEIPDDQREILRNGLLRYCELDTMAMVMLIEGWMNDL